MCLLSATNLRQGYGWHGQPFSGIDIINQIDIDRTKRRLPAEVNERKRDTKAGLNYANVSAEVLTEAGGFSWQAIFLMDGL